MTEDRLEGTGFPAHRLVFLDLTSVLAVPLYLYVEPWGRNLDQKPPQSRFCLKGKSPTWTPGLDARVAGVYPPWRLASGLRKTSFCTFHKPRGLSPLAQIKCSRAQTFRETSGTPFGEFWNPSGDQTLLSTYKSLLSDHSGVPRHIRDLIQNSEQHSVTNIHNS